MQKLFLLIVTACVSVAATAQDLTGTVFYGTNAAGKKQWYEGQIRDKKPHGMGIRRYNGTLYIGDFSNGETNGCGMMLTPQGSSISNCGECVVYVGNWRNGKKSGMGTCYAENGDVIYSGKFEEDRPTGTYPSKDGSPLRHFSFVEYDDDCKYMGETNDGTFDGFGVFSWANGDLWFGNFRDGAQKGIGLYMFSDAEWAVLNYNGDDCMEINSSAESREKDAQFKAARAQVRAYNTALLTTALTEGLTKITASVQELQNIKNGGSEAVSSYDPGEGGSAGSGGNSSKTSGGSSDRSNTMATGRNWQTDSNTYSNYESQLIKMRTYPENYSNYTADYTDIQAKMRRIREKWEGTDYRINKSQYE